MSDSFRLICRFLLRDLRSGELTALMLALTVAVSGMTATSCFVDRLNRTTRLKASEFLAADLVVTAHSRLPERWAETAAEAGLQTASTREFASVLLNGEKLLLCGVKAVSDRYPLRGALETKPPNSESDGGNRIPDPGHAWVAPRVLGALGLNTGDRIRIGDATFTITREILYEPDRRGNFLSLAPRVLINQRDLAATGMVQPGSHVHYYELFAGPRQSMKTFSDWLQPQLEPAQKLLDIYEHRPELGAAFTRAERYLGLTTTVVVLICGVAIAMAVRRYSERHFNLTAILRCLGSGKNAIYLLFGGQLLLLGLVAGVAGSALGWLSQEVLVFYLAEYLPADLLPPGPFTLAIGVVAGLVVLAGFSLPPLLRQGEVSPLRVLRRDLAPPPPNVWMVYTLGGAVIFLLLYRYTHDPGMVGLFLGGLLVAASVLSLLVILVLRASRRLLVLPGFIWRFAVSSVCSRMNANVVQILAFAVTMTAMIVILVIRTDLLQTWEAQLDENAPNYFALNIFDTDSDAFNRWLERNGLRPGRMFPVVRGRLTEKNGKDVHTIADRGPRGESVINRDLTLTYTRDLPDGNRIVRGEWSDQALPGRISVEQRVAESLGISPGDVLSFRIGSRTVQATVASIRTVNWDSMNPNFYVIFSPGTLEDYPLSYLTSFHVPEGREDVIPGLAAEFPAVTLLEVGMILGQIQSILAQVSLAVEAILVFSLLAGLTVLFAAVYSSLDERLYSASLLRAFGASARQLRDSQFLEFFLLGLISGLFAASLSEVILRVLYSRVFELQFHTLWWIWTLFPAVAALLIGGLGHACTRRVVHQSPATLLRELQ